jgi:hypothetical protein
LPAATTETTKLALRAPDFVIISALAASQPDHTIAVSAQNSLTISHENP